MMMTSELFAWVCRQVDCMFTNSTSFSLLHHIQFAKLLGPILSLLAKSMSPNHQFHISNTTLPACQNNFTIWTARMWFKLLKFEMFKCCPLSKISLPKIVLDLNALLVNLGLPTIEFFFPGCLIQERGQFLDFSFG